MTNQPTGKAPHNCFAVKGSPYWQYEMSIKGHRERGSTKCVRAKDAANFVAERRVAITKAISARNIKRGNAISLEQACQRYMDDKGSALKAAVTYSGQIKFLTELLPAGLMLRDLDNIALLDYRRDRKQSSKKPIKNSSINREIELLRRIWRWSNDLKFDCGEEPKWSLAIDNGAEVERIRELTDAEEQRLMAALKQVNPDLIPIVEFAMITGQRKTPIILLEWRNIDFQNRLATIVLKSKGEAPKMHSFPLSARAMEIISAQPKTETNRVFTFEGRANRTSDTSMDKIVGGRYPFTVGGWARDWYRALEMAGIEDFRFHDLRHTAASRLVRATGNLKIAQTLLAHSTITQTSRYAHAFHDDVRDALEKVAQRKST